MKKNEFDLDKATGIFYESLLFDEKQEKEAEKKQMEAIRYAEQYARLGNNEAKKFVITLAQGKKGTLGEFVLNQYIKSEAFNSICYFFGNYIRTQCIKKFKLSNPNATYDEMDEDVNGAVSCVWIEIINDFSSYDPEKGEFSTWSQGRILGGIQNYLAEKKGRKSKTSLQIDKVVYNAEKELREEGVISPSAITISKRCGLSIETVKNSLIRKEAENKTYSIENLYTSENNDDYRELNLSIPDTAVSEELLSPEKQLALKERTRMLLNAISTLNKDEKDILCKIQGISITEDGIFLAANDEKMTITEISKESGMQENKIANLYSTALKKMKNYIEKEDEELNKNATNKNNFLSERRMMFSDKTADEDLFLIIDSINKITD
ncbi:MAG: sigma-70 family RNA polymerase sigma factor [Lachnospiraceae bacterium]